MSGDNKARQPTCYNCYFLICLLLFLGGLVEVLSWILFFCWPHKIHATLASATLSNLTVSNASTATEVSYNLAATLRLYNPSSDVSIYYDAISAELRFRDAVLGPAATGTSPAEFYQRRETTDHVKLEFDYGRGVAVPSDVVGELETEVKSGGPINMELYVHLRMRYKFELFKMREKPEVRCWLSFPVKEGRGPGVGGVEDSGDQCSFKYSR